MEYLRFFQYLVATGKHQISNDQVRHIYVPGSNLHHLLRPK
ncbi:hypothetical protein LCAZH_0021 [Lacticaseibacillus paracasei]|uniref:Uncharacterized protein n=1 Tax=Lacticaseibacillus paracasei subsp. paracasei TaxID=47714 RepID=A0AAP9HDV5_LACPA|nr:hypothetical protein LCAZH_0021 [Lacticaseibacillus paracasei]EPC16831.1 hypothetical protein Lpp226_2719 [Lacticaseibacillus paracasei subsp. paracasei Lpp226]EPC23307.1 hypothetical protein Lpp17_2280 [Lacticaseibacillus paracasei subsp. paracasei Lpp17]EPC28310.1 hypothetical protein Lpp46_0501 [Lacticaseibacillus paracasei subsp. paracasei Lpp46]QGV16608.1 Hypothetical protein LCAKO_0022 [Lacticaseibacillus paracasei subsp. paracasei]